MKELPEDVQRLLDDERAREELSGDGLDAAWGVLHASVLEVESGTGPGEPAPAPPSPPAALRHGATWATRAALLGAATVVFGAGVLVGRATSEPAAAPRPAMSVAAAPTALAVPTPPIAAIASADAEAAPIAGRTAHLPSSVASSVAPQASSSARAATAQAPVPAGSSTLADERALVEGSRTALLRGRASDALALAEKHEALYPRGGLAEDRDFLIVSALHDLGRIDESRERAATFLSRYPKSALRVTVERMNR